MSSEAFETTEPSIAIDSSSSIFPDAELSRFSRELLTFAAVFTVLIMIAGIAGNFLTLLALVRCPRIRNVASAFIVSLCAADLAFCLLVLPFSSSRFVHGGWIHGPLLCTLFPFLRYGNVGASLMSIAMITVNRYVMIAHHGAYGKVYRPGFIAAMIAACWAFSYGMQLPTLFGIWGKFGRDDKLGTCSIVPDENGRSSKSALFVIAFLIPCVVICCCYARIFWVVRSSERRMREHAAKGRATSRKEDTKSAKARRNEWKITKMVLVIFLSFVSCYLPITIVKIADDEVGYPGLHVMGYILLYFSSCVNPIIYVIMNNQYRQAYKTVLFCKKPRNRSSTHYNQSSFAEKSKEAANRTTVSQVPIVLNNLA